MKESLIVLECGSCTIERRKAQRRPGSERSSVTDYAPVADDQNKMCAVMSTSHAGAYERGRAKQARVSPSDLVGTVIVGKALVPSITNKKRLDPWY
jgi:hypothetical protein